MKSRNILYIIFGLLIAIGIALAVADHNKPSSKTDKTESSHYDDYDNKVSDEADNESSSRNGKTSNKSNSNRNLGDILHVNTPADVKSQIKDYVGFRVSYNADNATPNWVAWELLASETEGNLKRNDKFHSDDDLENCSTPADYKKSGFDKGHLCPAADQKWSEEAMFDCFVMSNMAPQAHALNSGAWQTLEECERRWAKRDSAIVIVAGPIYSDTDSQRIGRPDGPRVPSAFFKALAAPYLNNPRAIAFVYPNMTAPGNMAQYVMTVRELEKLTGFDLFADMPDSLQNVMESVASFKDWNR